MASTISNRSVFINCLYWPDLLCAACRSQVTFAVSEGFSDSTPCRLSLSGDWHLPALDTVGIAEKFLAARFSALT
jgi:hypothetical protein